MVVNQRHGHGDLLLALDVAYLGQFLGQRVNDLVLARCKRQGFPGLTVSHGYIVQHLVDHKGPVTRTGSELGRRLGVTQQAASKAIAELVRLGVVEVAVGADRRAKHVRLSRRGWQAVQCARTARVGLEKRLAHHVGARRYRAAQETLRACLALVGGVDAIRSRRVRQPR